MNLWGREYIHNYVDEQRMDLFENTTKVSSLYPSEAIKELCDFGSNKALMEQSSYYDDLLLREDNNFLSVKKLFGVR